LYFHAGISSITNNAARGTRSAQQDALACVVFRSAQNRHHEEYMFIKLIEAEHLQWKSLPRARPAPIKISSLAQGGRGRRQARD